MRIDIGQFHIDAVPSGYVSRGQIITMMVNENKFRMSYNLDREFTGEDAILALNDWFRAKEERDAERQRSTPQGD
jgi:hypothetical protein